MAVQKNYETKPVAPKIETAVIKILKEGKVRTADLGGTATTSEMANVIVAHLKLQPSFS